MTSQETAHLRHFLTAFDVHSLGQGDALAGANLLAAMAVSLSNLARPGSGIVTPEGRRLKVGCHLLATGSQLTRLVHDEVVAPVSRSQGNLLRQLSCLLKREAQQEERSALGLLRDWKLAEPRETGQSEQALFSIMTGHPEDAVFCGGPEDAWTCVVAAPPVDRLEDLTRCPRAFMVATTPDQLEKQIIGTHRGEALVVVGLQHSGDAARFGELCPALMDGMVPAGPSGETVRGHLLVTVPERILRGEATTPGDMTTWLAALPWLVEGEAGPDLPGAPENEDITALNQLDERFELAVQQLFGNRLNGHRAAPVILKADVWDRQCRWTGELRQMERDLPGISGAARTLPASLIFGLQRLVGVAKEPGGFRYSIEGVEAFARLLVRRMANYRAALLFSVEEAWKLKDKRRILAKLADGRLDNRDLYRSLHLAASLCEHLLSEMERDGQVRRNGRKWERVEGATLPDGPAGYLPFEV